MKQFLLIIFLLTICAAGFSQTKPAPAKKPATPVTPAVTTKPAPSVSPLKTTLDSMSYAIGLIDGKFFRMQGVTKVNAPLMGKGFDDAIKDKALMTPEQADQLIRRELQQMSRRKIQPNIDSGMKFMAANGKRKEVKMTASGIQYEVLREGTGPQPADTNTVKVHYDGYLLNGFKFDSSRDRGEPSSFPLNQVIRGWTEGVQLMKVGSRYKFWIPYQLAYGEQGAGERIPGGSTLMFDVELLEIVK